MFFLSRMTLTKPRLAYTPFTVWETRKLQRFLSLAIKLRTNIMITLPLPLRIIRLYRQTLKWHLSSRMVKTFGNRPGKKVDDSTNIRNKTCGLNIFVHSCIVVSVATKGYRLTFYCFETYRNIG